MTVDRTVFDDLFVDLRERRDGAGAVKDHLRTWGYGILYDVLRWGHGDLTLEDMKRLRDRVGVSGFDRPALREIYDELTAAQAVIVPPPSNEEGSETSTDDPHVTGIDELAAHPPVAAKGHVHEG